MEKTVVGYVRVSTEGQAQKGVSLAEQRARIEEWAGSRVATIYADEGLSGARASNRPGLEKAIVAACKSRGVLVVCALSRLARSTEDAAAIIRRLEAKGAGLVSLSEQIDTTSAMGRFIVGLLAGLAQMERELIGERTKAALGHLRAQGRRVSGRIPFGFDLQRDGSLTENAEEQKAIRFMVERRKAGASVREIADALRSHGVKTKDGRTVWCASAVHRLVRRAEQAA